MSSQISRNIFARKTIAVFLVLALILSMSSPALGVVNEPANGTSPTVTIVANGVNGTFIEVGFNVQSQNGDTSNPFHMVGTILSYNANLMQPVTWDSGDVVELPSVSIESSQTAAGAYAAWNDAVALPTKGPDNLSGKTALAYTQTDDSGAKTGYLYLSAESPYGMPNGLWQELPYIIPFREGHVLPASEGDDTPGVSTSTNVPFGFVKETGIATSETDNNGIKFWGDDTVYTTTQTVASNNFYRYTEASGVVTFVENVYNGGETNFAAISLGEGTRSNVTGIAEGVYTLADGKEFVLAANTAIFKIIYGKDGGISAIERASSVGEGDTVSIQTRKDAGEPDLTAETEREAEFVVIHKAYEVPPVELGPEIFTAAGVPVYIPAVADSQAPAEKVETAISQAVVVRFKLTDESNAEQSLQDALASIDLVKDSTDPATYIAGQSQIFDSSGAIYLPGNRGADIPANVRLLRVTNGTTYFSGGGGAQISDFIPVIFYDWDGVTILGSKLINKTGAGLDEAINEFTGSMMKGGYDSATYDPTVSNYDETGEFPLSAKRGYSFVKWVDMNPVDANGNEAYTGYGRGIAINNSYGDATIAEPNSFTVPEGATNVMVQAAYVSNVELDSFSTINDPVEHYYTVTDTSYLQFADSTNYEITVHIQRGHGSVENWTPVPRVRKLGIRIGMLVKGNPQTVYMLQRLDNQDDLTASFAVTDQVEEVYIEAVDLCDVVVNGGTTNWATGTIPRSNRLVLYPTENNGKMGFIQEAGVGFFNDACRTADLMGDTYDTLHYTSSEPSKSGISAADTNYKTAVLDYNRPVYNSANGAAARRVNALANIFQMYQSISPRRNLTWDEMQEAIKRGTVWDSENNQWTNGFTGTYVP